MGEIVRRPNSLTSPFSDNEGAIVDAFLAAQDVKPSSKETYRRQLMQFKAYLTDNRVHNPTRETIIAFKTALQNKGLPLFASTSNRNSGGRLTTRTIRGLVKKQLRGIGLDDSRKSAHSLRHTFATLALSNGAPVTQVQEAMRHKDISTTMVYVHLMNRLKNAAERYVDF